jgi:isopentenyl phosphate kinase
LAATRLSVQKLNKIVVGALLDHGVNAIGISPCLNVPGVEAHVVLQGPTGPASLLRQVVQRTLEAGLVPILHGDACLYGHDQVGILSGDTLVEIIGTTSWISSAVFLTDVDGVFTDDPRINPNARLLREIAVDTLTNELIVVQSSSDGSDNNGDAKRIKTVVSASGSSHSHDVTGGLKVSCLYMIENANG